MGILFFASSSHSFFHFFFSPKLFIANLTKEEAKDLENFWFILSPAAILFPMGGFTGIVLFANLVDKYGR